jgi:hypothetical protein
LFNLVLGAVHSFGVFPGRSIDWRVLSGGRGRRRVTRDQSRLITLVTGLVIVLSLHVLEHLLRPASMRFIISRNLGSIRWDSSCDLIEAHRLAQEKHIQRSR